MKASPSGTNGLAQHAGIVDSRKVPNTLEMKDADIPMLSLLNMRALAVRTLTRCTRNFTDPITTFQENADGLQHRTASAQNVFEDPAESEHLRNQPQGLQAPKMEKN